MMVYRDRYSNSRYVDGKARGYRQDLGKGRFSWRNRLKDKERGELRTVEQGIGLAK